MMKRRGIVAFAVAFFAIRSLFAWGATAHRIINHTASTMIPATMVQFAAQDTFFENHASDADNRKYRDSTESMKHFIDIDSYPDFRRLSRDYDSLVAIYGVKTVQSLGVLPWAVVWCYDSLTVRLARGDWTGAYQWAADLGHYIGDANIALHATKNYNGQLSGNTGIHARYETAMVDSNIAEIESSMSVQSVAYIGNVRDCIFTCILDVNSYVDSIMNADTKAKSVSGWSATGSAPAAYYQSLWSQTKTFTKAHLQRAATTTASLWYSAWIDAQLISKGSVRRDFAPGSQTFSTAIENPNEVRLFSLDGRRVFMPFGIAETYLRQRTAHAPFVVFVKQENGSGRAHLAIRP